MLSQSASTSPDAQSDEDNTMNNVKRLVALLVLVCLSFTLFACGGGDGGNEPTDFAADLKLDMTSSTLKIENVTVKNYIDGDTTHFNVPTSISDNGVLKARYLAVNTPESTGKIEEWGKKASNFTKEHLKSATSIILESDTETLNADSTGTRFLVWVWYKTADDADYRNLNLELLQNGLAIASNSANNRYGTLCMKAISQASTLGLHVYSDESDPDFYYGDVIALDLKELKYNIEDYVNTKVSFECIVTKNDGQAIYVESYDADTDITYGMYVYYGFGADGFLLDILAVGNHVKIVGSVQYYETGGTYQISDLTYHAMRPTDPSNSQLLDDEKYEPNYKEITVPELLTGKVEIALEDEVVEYKVADLALYSTVEIKNLRVKSTYTTSNGGDNDGAISLTCEDENGNEITVRTIVMKNADGTLVKASVFDGKTISVRGIVDYYSESRNAPYQIKIFTLDDVVFAE